MVPVNISLFTKDRFEEALNAMKPAFQNKMGVSDRIAIAQKGEKLGDVTVPDGKVGLATVCSILINGIFLKYICGFVDQEFLYFFIGYSRDKKFHRFGIIYILMKSHLLSE